MESSLDRTGVTPKMLPRCATEPTWGPHAPSGGSSDLTSELRSTSPLLSRGISRGKMLRVSGGAIIGLLLAGCGPNGDGSVKTAETTATFVEEPTSAGAASGADAKGRGIIFNTASKDVTLFDPGTNRVTGSRPTSAVVRWLSNEQHYFDGAHIWTYDYPEGAVQAIAIDPETFKVTKQVPVGGVGPGHSFVLTPDNKRGFVNCAGSDFLAVVDPAAGEVIGRVETGAYPWDFDLSPDGRFGYVPERDQDTVAMVNATSLKVTKRVGFPMGSRPWMLRVSPEGREVWVQTASGTNVVLDARTLERRHTERVGNAPVTTAWSPDGRYNFVSLAGESYVAILNPQTGKVVKRLEVGKNSANVSFRPDGEYGYVAVTGENAVAVVEMESLEVESRLAAGQGPMGLIVL